MEDTPIIVVGHKNPDTDSICSAIALKNQITPGSCTPKRAGTLNNETSFVLDYFHVKEPELIEDVNTQVMDIEYRKIPGIPNNISIKDAWKMMGELDAVTLPIVGHNNMLEGIITVNDIATSYMDVYDNDILAKAKTPYSNLVDVLEGTLVAGNPHNHIVNGKVSIGAANPQLIGHLLEKDDIMIVGDQVDTQMCGIEMGIGCMILCMDAPVNPLVLQLAKERECSVITTKLDAYTVSRLINQSIPVKYFMRKQNLITFQLDDTVDSIKEIMSKKRHRDFPIVDDLGHYCGMVSRRNLLALRRKKVILVDHNEKSQAVDGIEDAEISITTDSVLCRPYHLYISAISRWVVPLLSFIRCTGKITSPSTKRQPDFYVPPSCQTLCSSALLPVHHWMRRLQSSWPKSLILIWNPLLCRCLKPEAPFAEKRRRNCLIRITRPFRWIRLESASVRSVPSTSMSSIWSLPKCRSM